MLASGLYRNRNGWRAPNSVKVRYYDGYEVAISETKYRGDGFLPASKLFLGNRTT